MQPKIQTLLDGLIGDTKTTVMGIAGLLTVIMQLTGYTPTPEQIQNAATGIMAIILLFINSKQPKAPS